GRRVLRVLEALEGRLVLEPGEQRPRDAAVGALEDARRADARVELPVRRGHRRDLRDRLVALRLLDPLARPFPGLAEVLAAPDRRAVPFAAGTDVDRSVRGVLDRVVDGPALAEGATGAPAVAVVAIEDEEALAGADEQRDLGHGAPFRGGPSVSIHADRRRPEKSSLASALFRGQPRQRAAHRGGRRPPRRAAG